MCKLNQLKEWRGKINYGFKSPAIGDPISRYSCFVGK
jgi:hypothetical protein